MLETFERDLSFPDTIVDNEDVVIGAIDEILEEYQGCVFLKLISDTLFPYFSMNARSFHNSLAKFVNQYGPGHGILTKSLGQAVKETFPGKSVKYRPFPRGVYNTSLLVYRDEPNLEQYILENSEVDGDSVRVAASQYVFG